MLQVLPLRLALGETETVDMFGNAAHVVATSYMPSVVSVRPSGLGIGGGPTFEIVRTGRAANAQVAKVAFQCRVTGQKEVVEVQLLDSAHWTWDQVVALTP